MPRFITRKQIQNATDTDIETFFEETIFEGIYCKEIRSKKTDYYKGSISDIKLNGRPTNILPIFLNVPKSSRNITEGPCSFRCRIKLEALRATESKYIVNLIGSSLINIASVTEPNIVITSSESKEEDLFEMWGVEDCYCIGYYHYNEKEAVYLVEDLRKPNFDHIPYYPGDLEKKPIRISYPHPIRGIKENDYYLFRWKLSHRNKYNPYEIFLDFKAQPKSIEPKWFIDTLFNDRHNDKSKNFGSATNFLDTLSKQLSARESTFVYELLQNANDYPVEGEGVDVEFHITDNYLLFLHSGDKFNVRNISGICGINEKEKIANKKTIGYKGIGFKTVFLNNHYVYLRTGDYSFRFDEGETPEKKVGGKIKRLGAPFQILPIWTTHNEIANEVNDIFDNSENKFRVKIALRPDNKSLLHIGKNCYENLFREVFSDSNIILFIPNINSVRIFINGQEECVCFRNNEEWIVGDYESEIRDDLQILINKTIEKGNSRIPEKYKDFDFTKVSFACKHKGAMITPVEDATLYCYLPTRASWGFPFLMNSDMIPKGDRNDIETEVKLIDEDETNFNEELASIAGTKFFLWIQDLITSKNYHLGSIFSLIPNFKKCKREHKDYSSFIEKFEEAFDTCLETKPIVPVSLRDIAIVNRVILDTTGLSTSGIMTDDEFIKFTEMEDYYLPLPILRKNKHFNSFLNHYAGDDQIFDTDCLQSLISNDDFKEWLRDQDNNNKFLNFLLENNYLEDYLDEDIFIESKGGLFSSGKLYFNVDKYLVDLKAFTDHINYLSPKTRDFFAGNTKWEELIKEAFLKFDTNKFVNDVLLNEGNIEATKKRLKDFDTSIHFYKFLSENVNYSTKYTKLPFFDINGKIIENFNDKFIFFHNKEGEAICSSEWLINIAISFVHDSYSKTTKEYFKNFDIQEYSDDIIIKNIILSDDYKDKVGDTINEDLSLSIDFINFCFRNKDIIPVGGLRSYTINVFNCDGDSEWFINENDVYFPSSHFDFYSQKEWIDSSWLTCLNSAYFPNKYSEEQYKQFFKETFGIAELSDEVFYKNVVRKNLSTIFEKIRGRENTDKHKNFDFIKYLDENYQLIFEDENDGKLYTGLIIISDEGSEVKVNKPNLYIFHKSLCTILEYSWMPKKIVTLAHRNYGNSRVLTKLGIVQYSFSNFYDNVIVDNIISINTLISTVNESVAFHNFIIEHLGELKPAQVSKMKQAKVYLFGISSPVMIATGHKILSNKANELFKLGLVKGSSLDLIASEYKPEANTEYWETRLGNSKFTLNHFATWLKNNKTEFEITLKNRDLNITFWRWVKENFTDSLLKEVKGLPILVSNNEIPQTGVIFFSDDYLAESKIESTVRRFNNKTNFLSPSYIREGQEISEWKDFFIKIGIKFEIVDILIETINTSLSEIEDSNLVKLITDNREALEKHYEGDLVNHLHNLRVQVNEVFYPVSKIILIDGKFEEPFVYITIPNQISYNYSKEQRLILELVKKVNGQIIASYVAWQQLKIDHYLRLQAENNEQVRPIHFQFINDLAYIRNNNKESINELLHIEKIKLLDKHNLFCEPTSLTVGTKYNPFFDFEKYGITDLKYVSDDYMKCCSEYVGKFFGTVKMHRDFTETDIKYLAIRECAIYFWSTYLAKQRLSNRRIDDIKKFITEGKFDSVSCIPTKDSMKRPSELYYGSEVNWYLNKLEDWENKTPLLDLPDVKIGDTGTSLFTLLHFKKSLDFLDALYALFNVHGKNTRPQLLLWLIEKYNDVYFNQIAEYRADEHATWLNTQNESKQISSLYALEHGVKTLEQYFGSNSRIINKDYFPLGESFEKACNILQIKIITEDDLIMEPVNKTLYLHHNTDLKLYILVIAGITDSDNWKKLYNEWYEKLDTVTLYQCESILLKYKEDPSISQSHRKFYHKERDTDFYFVDSLDGKRVFQAFVNELISYLEIKGIPSDLVEDIMDSRKNALKMVLKNNTLMLDEDFKSILMSLVPEVSNKLLGKEAQINDDEISILRCGFSMPQNNIYQDEPKEEEPSIVHDTNSDNSHHRIDNVGRECTTQNNDNTKPVSDSSHQDSTSDKGNNTENEKKGKDYADLRESTTNPSSFNQTRSYPRPFTSQEVNRMRSNPSPLALESLPPTKEELEILNKMNITPEQIADTNYLAQLRLYQNLVDRGEVPEETKEEFVHNAADVTTHKLVGGRYIHTCSAARGVMYVSPSVWEKMLDDKWEICVYLDGKGSKFHYIKNKTEFLQLVEKDDVVIKITGKEKVDVVNQLYSETLNGVIGTAYTLIRVAATTNMDAVFAHYIGAMAEKNYGNDKEESLDEY